MFVGLTPFRTCSTIELYVGLVPLSNFPSGCVPKFMLWRIWSDMTVDCVIDQVSVLINVNLKIDTKH